MAAERIGTIITTIEGPSVGSFSFVINSKKGVKRGQYVSVKTDEGILIANVSEILKTNKYFESAGAVCEYGKAGDLHTAFPTKEWEYTIAKCETLGVYDSSGLLNRTSFPPSPGSIVEEIDVQLLNKFLGLDQEKGLELGNLQQHDLKAKFNLTKMIQKHMAILAMSGSGKSYATGVLMEELLLRNSQQGRIAILVIDNHGEYVSFANDENFKDKVKVIDGNSIKIGVSGMSERGFAALIPKISHAQVRELGKIIKQVRENNTSYDLNDIFKVLEEKDLSKGTSNALFGWLTDLQNMDIFEKSDWPNIEGLLEQGKMIVITLRDILDIKKKQLIVNHISRKLFDLRKADKVPPYLEIIEEAHNFCPGGDAAERALSRGIIELLAREGRKFYANICLISQRPIQLSTTALSQCNTQIILRITNPNDLDHIGKSSEAISKSTLEMISGLKVGEALVLGEAVNYPVFVKIRQRRSKEVHGQKLEDYAINFEKKKENSVIRTNDFL